MLNGGDSMAKVVAVQNGLDDIVMALEERGCKIVGVDQIGYPLTAMVYSNEIDTECYSPTTMDIHLGADDNGYVLMLNAGELSIEEIVSRIIDI